ncbi:MAG: S41 family peptidase [Candidatus Saccharibacteria bacterium]|nr:S41 family peptidase [Candidatus Saccharibacteria bacterium]
MKKVEWRERRVKLGNAIIVGAAFTLIGVYVGMKVGGVSLGFMLNGSGETGMNWSPLDEVYNKLATSYNGEINREDVINGAKEGLVAALGDKYTVYLNAEDSASFYDDLHGNVGAGIGVEMGLRDGYVRVLRTLPDNPARAAGILAGDIIYKVDGEEVWRLTSEDVAQKIRGESGTEVSISVIRGEKEINFNLKREAINNVSAYVEYNGDAAILTLTRFDKDTGTRAQQIAQEFKERGVKKVILDLRGNGGGYVSAAQDLLSLWLDGQKCLEQKSKHYGDIVTSTFSGKAILKDMETVVLVNGSTASASEIVAGALQDYKKATIIGETTYGKGVVQNLFDLSGGTTLKVTTAEWYTPNGRSINGAGIQPDIVVERTYEDINAMKDPQMDRAKEI